MLFSFIIFFFSWFISWSLWSNSNSFSQSSSLKCWSFFSKPSIWTENAIKSELIFYQSQNDFIKKTPNTHTKQTNLTNIVIINPDFRFLCHFFYFVYIFLYQKSSLGVVSYWVKNRFSGLHCYSLAQFIALIDKLLVLLVHSFPLTTIKKFLSSRLNLTSYCVPGPDFLIGLAALC